MPDPTTGPKPGVKSTEFWMTFVVAVAPQVMAFLEKVSPDTAIMISGFAAIVYTIARAFIKKGADGSNA